MGVWAIAVVTVFSLGVFINIVVENLTSPLQKPPSNENEEDKNDFDDQYCDNSTQNESDYWTDLAEYMSIIEERVAFVFFSVVSEPSTPSCSMVPPQCNCSQDEDTDSDISDDYSDLGDIDYYFKDYDWSHESIDVHE
ncbi:7477_t:CDS:2 [Cetraspora pellucida]|uniref:7477_t:CDS:1 n=1 Tax=Cetraspora pellucida TaxID=1433469 RepID=A0A9N8ZMR5_9GLOM|nr:7477_t:CDS:2 [Cetraspora pellucida]